MQLLWQGLVNVSFGYLMLIPVVRIVQELKDSMRPALDPSKS